MFPHTQCLRISALIIINTLILPCHHNNKCEFTLKYLNLKKQNTGGLISNMRA